MGAFKYIIAVLVTAALCIGPSLGQPQSAPGEVIIGLNEEAPSPVRRALQGDLSALRKQNRDLREGVASASRAVPSISRPAKTASTTPAPDVYRVRVRDTSEVEAVADRWRRRSGVSYAHPNYTLEVHRRRSADESRAVVNALADSLDHLDVVGARSAWSLTRGREDVQIGVVDTGFFLDHPDLRNQFWVNGPEDLNNNGRLDPSDLNGVDDDGNGVVDDVIGYDFVDRAAPVQEGEYQTRDPDPGADPTAGGSDHGTAVAGVAAASMGGADGVNGVAPGTNLVALRAFGGDGFGQSDDIAAAIVYGASVGVDVLNLSFGRNRAVPVIRDAIDYAIDQGTVVVASAGNELTDDPHYPSDYPDVLSVVWLAEDGEGLPTFNRSQFGIGVDIGAPGSDVFTTTFPADLADDPSAATTDDLYRSYSGSSFSAPQVAGAAALLRSVDSTLSPASIRSILTASAEDLEAENWDHTTGAGLLQAGTALGRAYPARTEITRPAHNQGYHERRTVPVVGTAVDPSFRHYSVSYAEGTRNFDTRRDPWTEIRSATETQVLRDTLARWDLSALEPGSYTLRLVTTLRDGRTIEDRRRVIIDRTAPTLRTQFLGSGRVDGENGVVGDLATDDRTRLTTTIRLAGREATVQSEQVARRHGLAWPDREGTGGTARVRVTAENRSGLRTTLDTTLRIPPNRENTALLRRTETDVPRGALLPAAPDFDGDGLRGLVLNRSAEGGLSDSLRAYEWTGEGFALADSLRARLFPRDVGDTNRDGRRELLLQVRGGTLLLEQETPRAFPDSLVFADTVGGGTSLEDVANGARLADLDADGRGEVLATSSSRIVGYERTASGFSRAYQLSNPTGRAGRDSALANAVDTPTLQTGDFDADGRRDLLAGDRDGDLLVYEATGDDELTVAWTHETDQVDAGNRFAAGNFVPGPEQEFATMVTYAPGTLENGEFAPPITYYSVWTATGDDQYERVYRLPVAGSYLEAGAMTAADLDADGLDEVVVSHAPSLYVLDRAGDGDWRVLHDNRDGAPLQSRRLVAADFSGSGTPSIVAETAGPRLVRFVVEGQALTVAPPRWVRAVPGGATSSVLEWRAPGADSVVVYGGPPGGALDRLATVADSSYTLPGPAERRLALRALTGGDTSPLSAARRVRPHAPATVVDVSYAVPATARLTFSEPLRPGLRPGQFEFGPEQLSPKRVVRTNGGRAVALHFSSTVAGRSSRLRWSGVSDVSGLPVADTAAQLRFPPDQSRTLFVEASEILGERRVELVFSEPLPASLASDASRYDLAPRGRVVAAHHDEGAPASVTLEVDGVVIGPNGRETSLTVSEMRSTRGSRLSTEGGTVRLSRPATDLSNVYVYPNPYRKGGQTDHLTIAGLPRQATIRVYAPDGRLVRTLSVDDNRDGGAKWDLRDRGGEHVPAGIYLLRVEAPDQNPVLEKAAVIR